MRKHQLVALGGTFDHFHEGHKRFLHFAFSLSKKAIVGITNNRLAATTKKLPQALQLFPERKRQVSAFLRKYDYSGRAKLMSLKDIYGPTLKANGPEALVATHLTYPGAKKVNLKRQQLGLKRLPIYVCPLVKSADGRYLSSTRIRQGLVSRKGQVYSYLFRKNLIFSPSLRQKLKRPLGQLITKNIAATLKDQNCKTHPLKIVVVGDYLTHFFIEKKLIFSLGLVDFKIKRRRVNTSYPLKLLTTVKNPAGGIKQAAAKTIFRLVVSREKGIIRVLGEEDLLAIPAVLSLPLGSLVIYGQPNKGCVVVEVNEKSKEKFAKLLL